MGEIVIVGSGASFIGSGLGEKIDSFENVLRFGGSEKYLEQHKSDVGIKTTHLFYSLNPLWLLEFNKRINSNLHFYKNLKVTFVSGPKIKNLKRDKRRRRVVAESRRILDIHGIDHEMVENVGVMKNETLIPERMRVAHPTSGLVSIILCSAEYDNVYLCGFDALCVPPEKTITKAAHFFPIEHKHDRNLTMIHNINQEAKIIRHMMQTKNNIHILER